jgi:hypothetical protein
MTPRRTAVEDLFVRMGQQQCAVVLAPLSSGERYTAALMGSMPASIGRYRVIRQLGEGGMGTVFEAVHETIERRVAIKLLKPEYAHVPDIALRFVNEARAVNRVQHPGIVQISDHGQLPDGTAFIVMEFLAGETLEQRIHRDGGTLALADVLDLGWQLADALAAAHANGIIHRDVKPQNVMLTPDVQNSHITRTKVLDFGLAKLAGGALSKTSSNAIMGTPLYMSPEQCAGAGKVDARSDVYSLGCVLYEMLAGRPPFLAEGAGQLLGMHMYDQPEPLGRLTPATPKAVLQLVHSLLTKDQTLRPTMSEVAKQLALLKRLVPAGRPHTADATAGVSASAAQSFALGATFAQITATSGRRLVRVLSAAGFIVVACTAAITISTYHHRQLPVAARVTESSVKQPATQVAPRSQSVTAVEPAISNGKGENVATTSSSPGLTLRTAQQMPVQLTPSQPSAAMEPLSAAGNSGAHSISAAPAFKKKPTTASLAKRKDRSAKESPRIPAGGRHLSGEALPHNVEIPLED